MPTTEKVKYKMDSTVFLLSKLAAAHYRVLIMELSGCLLIIVMPHVGRLNVLCDRP